MFSIIIPVYNLEKYIERCIKSILNQNYSDFEIIIVNDGSTDKSKEICEMYEANDERIRIINISNSGPSVARNVGVSYATKRYIIFIDGDDFVNQGFLTKIANVVEEKKFPDLVVFNYNCFDSKKEEYINSNENVNECECNGNEYLEMVLKNRRIYSWYVWRYAYKRDFYISNGFEFTPNIHYEDVEFMYKVILHAKTVITIPYIYYNYVINRKESITGHYSIKSEIDKQKVVAANMKYILDNTKDNTQRLLLKNLFVIYSSSLHILYFFKDNDFKILLDEIENNKDICCYAEGILDKILAEMIKLVGIKKTAYILNIRARIKKFNT